MNIYSISEAAEKLGVSIPILRREISKKKLTGRKFGGRVYIIDSDLEAYVRNCSTNPDSEDFVVEQLFNGGSANG